MVTPPLRTRGPAHALLLLLETVHSRAKSQLLRGKSAQLVLAEIFKLGEIISLNPQLVERVPKP